MGYIIEPVTCSHFVPGTCDFCPDDNERDLEEEVANTELLHEE
jgi:hypothetical protein